MDVVTAARAAHQECVFQRCSRIPFFLRRKDSIVPADLVYKLIQVGEIEASL